MTRRGTLLALFVKMAPVRHGDPLRVFRPLPESRDDGAAEIFETLGCSELALPLVVYSHLRWESVFQRPQQLMSRLSRHRLVLFIEEPVLGREERWQLDRPTRDLLVATPILREPERGFHSKHIPGLIAMTRRLLSWRGVGPHVAWLDTPMAWPLARELAPELVVYDCMDELAAFPGAPPSLARHERELLQRCDLAFAAGPSLHRAKQALCRGIRCLPSSVEVDHFRRAENPTPPDQAAIPGPRLGFDGVLDERLDRDLLDSVAAAHSDWQLIIVGPVAKIRPSQLPRRPNIHYLGRRSYEKLPSYLAGWDLALLPFHLNPATRFISPTKTLEYMAAGKKIVSTPIRDVIDLYGEVVRIAPRERFVAACEEALNEGAVQRERRMLGMTRLLAQTSWDATAHEMQRALEGLEQRKRPVEVPDEAQSPRSPA